VAVPEVVIVGGGFGGLYAARGLAVAPARVTLVDRRNFHLFQPLLYQVASGSLSPANIAAPLRSILRRQPNARVLLGEVIDIDVAGRRAVLADGALPYDFLVLATGSSHSYFGHPDWEPVAPGLKTVEDATEIRRRVLRAFEAAERSGDPAAIRGWLTFVIVGGGPTGVELAGTVSELARHTLRGDFRSIDPAAARVLLVEAADRVLPPYRPALSAKARHGLEQLGVEVWTGGVVTDVRPGAVTVKCGDRTEVVRAETVVWAAGVQASPLGRRLAAAAGAEADRQGRVWVNPDLTVPGRPEVFVIGDLAAVRQAAPSQPPGSAHAAGAGAPPTLPGVAPVAMQEGRYVAAAIRRRLRGEAVRPFRYHDKGSMATIGRATAVADLGWVQFDGYLAWLTWLFIHILYLAGFTNRLLVLVQWGWSYVTRNRSARLITNESARPLKLLPPPDAPSAV
jgi:NADH dehydrogenase